MSIIVHAGLKFVCHLQQLQLGWAVAMLLKHTNMAGCAGLQAEWSGAL